MSEVGKSRRDFVKHSLYVAPAIVTLTAAPSFAKAGSGKPDSWGDSERERPDSPGKSGDAGRPDSPGRSDPPGLK